MQTAKLFFFLFFPKNIFPWKELMKGKRENFSFFFLRKLALESSNASASR